jgi:hypothetical protein
MSAVVAEVIRSIESIEAAKQRRAERLRERKAKSFYNSFAWRKLRFLYLRAQPRPLRCGACGRTVAEGATLCVDHVKSVKRHPELRLSLSNLQILCRDCNLGKGSEFADDFRAGEDKIAAAGALPSAAASQPPNPDEDEDRYLKFARLAVDAATRLAPYQSPIFRAVVVAPAPESNETKSRRFTLRIFDRDHGGDRADPFVETISYSTAKN